MPREGKEEPGQPREFEHLATGMIEPEMTVGNKLLFLCAWTWNE